MVTADGLLIVGSVAGIGLAAARVRLIVLASGVPEIVILLALFLVTVIPFVVPREA